MDEQTRGRMMDMEWKAFREEADNIYKHSCIIETLIGNFPLEEDSLKEIEKMETSVKQIQSSLNKLKEEI